MDKEVLALSNLLGLTDLNLCCCRNVTCTSSWTIWGGGHEKQFESMEDHTSTLEVKAPSTPQPGPSQHQPNTQENDLPGARAARPPKTRPRG
jgi:hypothetical protein